MAAGLATEECDLCHHTYWRKWRRYFEYKGIKYAICPFCDENKEKIDFEELMKRLGNPAFAEA
jgi:aspartate/tyrosine/aromatic aminotransferase